MKIRTSFVTNSSSYSSAEIKIDNPVLLKILKNYKERGAFVMDINDWGDRFEKDLSDDAFGERSRKIIYKERELANIFFAPKSIEDVADLILDVLIIDVIVDTETSKLKNKDVFEECKKELRARAKEINENYVEVSWSAENYSFGEFEPDEDEETAWEFHYHK